MLRVLLKLRRKELFYRLFGSGKKKLSTPLRILKGIGIGLLVIFLVAVLALIMIGIFNEIYDPFKTAGIEWMYYGLAGLLSVAVCIVGALAYSQSALFEAKDNELLLSLPIRPSTILVSRILSILLMNYFYAFLFMGTAGLVRLLSGPVTGSGAVQFFISFLLLPLIPTTIGCLAGWLVAMVTKRLPGKGFIRLAFSLAFMALYFLAINNLEKYGAFLIKNGKSLSETVRKVLPPIYEMGMMIQEHDWTRLPVLALWCIVPFVVLCFILSRTFVGITTAKSGSGKAKYESRALHSSSVRFALVKKDLRRLIGSSSYMLNCGLGVILGLGGSVLVAVRGRELFDSLMSYYVPADIIAEYTGPVATLVLCMICALTNLSAPALSLERNNYWILQTTPVSMADILLGKAYMHILVTGPVTVVSAVLLAVGLHITGADLVLLFVLPVLATVFMALFGITMNYWFPRMDYTSEAAVVKRSMPAFLTILVGLVIIAGPLVLYLFTMMDFFSITVFMVILGGILLAADIAMYVFLSTRYQTKSKL